MKTITEYSAFKPVMRVITKEEAFANKTEDIGYLKWVRADFDYSKWKRAWDEDILEKDFFVVDVDMRNNYEEAQKKKGLKKWEYEDVTNEEIIIEWKNFIKTLELDNELFWEWSKVVFTGGGLHIYYFWTERYIAPEVYKTWVKAIYNMWNDYFWTILWKADDACKNIARLLRLPWSINQKNGAKVEILAERKKISKLFNNIEKYAKIEQKRQDKLKQERLKQIEEQLKNFNWDNEFYLKINSIPAYQIAELLIPDFPFNWKKNFKNNKNWLTGYWYCADTNTIVNGWSRHFNWWGDNSCWNNFSLIKRTKNWDNRQTFEFFKQLLWQK